MSKIHAKILKEVRKDRYSNIRNGGGICNELRDVTKNSDDTYLYAKTKLSSGFLKVYIPLITIVTGSKKTQVVKYTENYRKVISPKVVTHGWIG